MSHTKQDWNKAVLFEAFETLFTKRDCANLTVDGGTNA
jgi:hypothetical protein